MWNYGSLRTVQEKEHIDCKMMMLEPGIEMLEKCYFFSELISESQHLIREYVAQEDSHSADIMGKSTVSPRDINHVFVIYNWLKQSFLYLRKYQENDESISLRALFVSLAVVYYFRLNSAFRKQFIEEMHKFVPPDHWKVSVKFKTALIDELDWTISNMEIPPGIAITEALKENVFVIVVCTMTHIPLILVGQPGSSKRLSFTIVSKNLLGPSSPSDAFRNVKVFKRFDTHFCQCGRKSEIEIVFQQAINRQTWLNDLNIVSIVMMDKAGLSERIHGKSLGVLQNCLDNHKVAFVGISNHVLDAGIMNKAVVVFRPEICHKDVEAFAKGCLLTHTEHPMKEKDANFVRSFTQSYLDVMQNTSMHLNTFFGLRDFIHFCSYLRRSEESFTPQLIMHSLERNFNGCMHLGQISCYFLERVFQVKLLCTA